MATRLADILGTIDTGIGKTVKACSYLSLWQEIVDERIGKNTEAVKLNNHILFVSTSTPVWAQELSFLKTEMIKKFNARAGEEAIKDIRFKSA